MDMIEFLGLDFVEAFSDLETEGALFQKWVNEHGAGAAISNDDRERLETLLRRLEKHCSRLQLVDSKNRIDHFGSRTSGLFEANFQMIESEISGLRHSLLCELGNRKLVFIPKGKSEYFERDDLFGEQFHKNAPNEINSEIKAAGNCIAADLNTAAVFHLMRAAEFGLRTMAAHLQVPIPAGDIEYKDWQYVIAQIEIAANKIAEGPATSPKERAERREFYNGVLGEFKGFKDAWCNNVMHTRGSYNALDALNLFNQVRSFMQRLSTKVNSN